MVFSQSIHAQADLRAIANSNTGKLIHFTPISFYNKFSLNIAPVLTINPADTISTETIDAMGFDKQGEKRQRGGNPLTGPFYIENAMAGDVLAITFTKISLNRSYAYTTESFVDRSLPKEINLSSKRPRLIKWELDIENGFAFTKDSAYERLKNFKTQLKPFLGCIGVAPANKKNEQLSFFPGPFGGNLDFSGIKEGATLYLPVFHKGAFLYVGDGHAIQGDGEIAGNALETSMNVSFTVQLIKKEILTLTYPRAEDAVYLMSIGVHKNLEGALKIATAGLLQWLQSEYLLSFQEASQVMSTSIEYSIAEIADPEVEVVAKIKKEILAGIK
jgi:acetamidase/formamidase